MSSPSKTESFPMDPPKSDEGPSSMILLMQEGQQVFTPPLTWYEGVIPQENDHWGAQIYVHNHLILLGTFESEIAAARAYDSAAIKFFGCDFFRNFFLTNVTIHEQYFQSRYTIESIIDMIRDGSYEPQFIEFFRIHYSNFRSSSSVVLPNSLDAIQGVFFKEIFQKELTLTDIKNQNIFVIPYQALQYFPPMKSNTIELWLEFKDRINRSWVFQYCYWNNTQSYAFTTGWSRFVNEMELRANDIVVFYRCRDWGNFPTKIFDMVDIIRGFRSSGKQQQRPG